jgi:hypothetical protein
MRRLRSGPGLAIGMAALALAVAGARLFGQTAEHGGSCEAPLAWDQAAGRAGQQAAVEGRVAATAYVPDVGGEPTFLNLGNPHPNPQRFDVVIYGDLREGFDASPENQFADRDVCVVGRVRLRDGVPQIVLRSPAAIITR